MDETLRQLKTDMATAKAEFRKAERELQEARDSGGDTGPAEAELLNRREALDKAAKAFAEYMAAKETD